jgi:hypothetical protein
VFLTGSDISLFTSGFVPGDSHEDRLCALTDPRAGAPRFPTCGPASTPSSPEPSPKSRAVRRPGQLRLAALRRRGLDPIRRDCDRCRLPRRGPREDKDSPKASRATGAPVARNLSAPSEWAGEV